MRPFVVNWLANALSWLIFVHILLWLIVSFLSGSATGFQRAGTIGIAGAIATWALVRWHLLEDNASRFNQDDRRRLVGIALKYEVPVVVLATLQTGYGDLLIKYFACRGVQC